MAEALAKADRMMALQFPVPPVPPVPPRDPRQKPRERDRRRIPEGWVEATEPFTRAFPVGQGGDADAVEHRRQHPGHAGRGGAIEVEALKHAWAPNAEQAKQRLPDALIESYATGNRVELRVEHGERRDGRGIEVEFNVKVPADATVDLRTVSGDIRVTNVKGEVRVQGVSGNLVARRHRPSRSRKDRLRRHHDHQRRGRRAVVALHRQRRSAGADAQHARARREHGERRRAHQRLVRRSRAHPDARRRSRSADEPREGRALRNRVAFRQHQPVASRAARIRARSATPSTAASASTSPSRARGRSATATAARARCAAPTATAARACGCRRSMET